MAMNTPVVDMATNLRLRYSFSSDGAGGGSTTVTNAMLGAALGNSGPLWDFLNVAVANDAAADVYCEQAEQFEIVAHHHTVDIITITPVRDGTGMLGFTVTSAVANSEAHITLWFIHSLIR